MSNAKGQHEVIICRQRGTQSVKASKEPIFRTFIEAQRGICKHLGGSGFSLEENLSIYVVRHHGMKIGQGVHWETAIADAESNLVRHE